MLRALGGGASAEVFHAVDQRDDIEVAIKLFPRASVRDEEFRREAAIAMRNTHPNLVRLVDAGVHEGRAFLALEYVDGFNGRALLYREGRTVDQVLDIARQTFAALDAMHGAGLAHGDIKPENLIIQDRHVRVVDFGRTRLAHVLGRSERTHAGTPPYMHPSLFHGLPPSAATDCFAAWVMTYELLGGTRPFSREQLQESGPDARLEHEPLPDPRLDALVSAGLSGRLADARSSWLAITRFQAGRRDLPILRPPPPAVRPEQLEKLLRTIRTHRSCAVVGDAEVNRPFLDAIDRGWRRGGGTAVWLTAGWRQDLPLADALSMVADLGESQRGHHLAEIATALGPLGDVLADAVPSARAWIRAGPSTSSRPQPERLALALRRMLQACPQPVLVLTRAFDRVDGASRRLLRTLVTAGDVCLVGSVPPDHEHGLAREYGTPPLPDPIAPGAEARLPREARELLATARVLDLPFGQLLARASGMRTTRVLDLAHDIEAIGAARWTGEAILPRPGPMPGPDNTRQIFARAAAALDPVREPWLVARYALRGDDSARLHEVLGPAVEAAARRDPAEALELLEAAPGVPTPDGLAQRFRIALLARDVPAAQRALDTLRRTPGASIADLAEAEGELAFRQGDTLTAIEAYERAADALGHPIARGLRGVAQDLRALWQIRRCQLPPARPDRRVARLAAGLYDLRFNHDNAYLLRLHRLWLQTAPDDPRALSIEVLWRQLLGRTAEAAALEHELEGRIREDTDPVGAAVVQLHQGMARLLRGETAAAFSDGIDAATRLLRAGDPYAAALASTLPAACAIHVAGAGPLARVHTGVLRLVADTGDERAARWAAGIDAVARWQTGDLQGAIRQAEEWARGSQLRDDASEALARRFLAELLMEGARWEAAARELERADVVARTLHVRMDYTDARFIDQLIVDAQARLSGRPGVRRRSALARRARTLVRRSPRWGPRLQVALAWQALADGDTDTAAERFTQARRDADARGQSMDAWWAMHHRALALADDTSRAAADSYADQLHIRQGDDSLVDVPSPLPFGARQDGP